jgi:aspartyl-tRNA(Asn)/glutamyl-tRNA(Gln) amidotransferase subunit A
MNPESSTIHYQTLRERADGFGPTARARLAFGNVIPATAYVHAQRVRKLMRDAYRELFNDFDAIVGPGSPTRADRADAESTMVNGEVVENRRLGDGYTNIYSLTGLPAMVLPAGFDDEMTPIGLQIATRWWDEATMLRIAHAFEQTTNWHQRRPPLPAGSN